MAAELRVKRIHEPPAEGDGARVLVDRLWPRGISKERAALDRWAKDVAPTTELRRWFNHDPARWDGFVERYEAELAANPAVDELVDFIRARGRVTLLHSVRDRERNHAVVLRRHLQARLGG